MGFWFDSFLLECVTVFVIFFTFIYWYFKNSFKYWENNGIAAEKPSFPFGNVGQVVLQKEHFGDVLERIYKQLKHKGTFFGIYFFNKPAVVVHDPDLIKNVLVRDFNHFHDHGFFYNEEDDPLSAHLLSIEGQKWKSLREKLTPTFTSGKMKLMFPTILNCSQELDNYLKEYTKKQEEIEMKDILARYATDVIGTCAFGIDCNSLKNPDAEFRKYGLKIFDISATKAIKGFLTLNKKIGKMLRIVMTDKDITKFFMGIVKETVEYREKNNITRNDFLQLLIELKNKGYVADDSLGSSKASVSSSKQEGTAFTMNQISAQVFIFFLAGFETSSTTMSFCLNELAQNKKLQEEIREEIRSVIKKYDGQITYEALLDMKYLDRAIHETLRKYPVLPVLHRECTKDYIIPGTDVLIPKGMPVFIPLKAIQHDSKYFPDPEIFDPDRFLEENKAKRHHFTYLPFGEGPRICIGLRFGMMQTRLGLIAVLTKYNLELSDKTPVPLVMDPKNFIGASSIDGIFLKLRPLAK